MRQQTQEARQQTKEERRIQEALTEDRFQQMATYAGTIRDAITSAMTTDSWDNQKQDSSIEFLVESHQNSEQAETPQKEKKRGSIFDIFAKTKQKPIWAPETFRIQFEIPNDPDAVLAQAFMEQFSIHQTDPTVTIVCENIANKKWKRFKPENIDRRDTDKYEIIAYESKGNGENDITIVCQLNGDKSYLQFTNVSVGKMEEVTESCHEVSMVADSEMLNHSFDTASTTSGDLLSNNILSSESEPESEDNLSTHSAPMSTHEGHQPPEIRVLGTYGSNSSLGSLEEELGKNAGTGDFSEESKQFLTPFASRLSRWSTEEELSQVSTSPSTMSISSSNSGNSSGRSSTTSPHHKVSKEGHWRIRMVLGNASSQHDEENHNSFEA